MKRVTGRTIRSLFVGVALSFLNLEIAHAADVCDPLYEESPATAIPGIYKVNNNLYTARNERDVHFALERVTQDTLPFWENFIDFEEGLVKGNAFNFSKNLEDPINVFKISLLSCLDVADVWIAYASRELPSSKKEFSHNYRPGDIEMSFTVLTLPDLPLFISCGNFSIG